MHMRVRTRRSTEPGQRRYRGIDHRRPEAPPADRPAAPGDDLAAERRLREAGGPDDRAQYTCTCGYVFEADVSTSVACPHCGAAQAW
jgi:rubrerythrin